MNKKGSIPLHLTKKCTQCYEELAINKLFCDNCGHNFKDKKGIKPLTVKERMAILKQKEMKEAKKLEAKKRMDYIRSNESIQKTYLRKQKNKKRVSDVRANESREQSAIRIENNKKNMANCRANESIDETALRNKKNMLHMSHLRANESAEEIVVRNDKNRQRMCESRANETLEAAAHRKQINKDNMFTARRDQTPEQSQVRKALNAASQRCNRSKTISLDDTIASFLNKIRFGPDYVCTVCHRMMYYHGVYQFRKDKYSKADPEMLHRVLSVMYVCKDGSQWVCHTCDRALKGGRIPVMAKINGFMLPEIPHELKNLNDIEIRLISLRIPFMKMVSLPAGKQTSIHGPTVNVPCNVNNICDVLPRLPSQSEIIALKLKRKLCYKGHYMHGYVRPDVVLNALSWLKVHNPLYKDIEINQNWVADAAVDDNIIFSSLLQEPSIDNNTVDNTHSLEISNDNEVPMESIESNSSVPAENVSVSDRVSSEINNQSEVAMVVDTPYSNLASFVKQHGYVIFDVPGDGSCLFHAIAHQLSSNVSASDLRARVVAYLRANPTTPDGSHLSDYISSVSGNALSWDNYLLNLSGRAWGDHITIFGLSNMLNIEIKIFTTLGSNIVTVTPNSGNTIDTIHIGQMGETHYVGLDPISSTNSLANGPSNLSTTCNIVGSTCIDSVACAVSSNADNDVDPDTLDDATIREGDEHIRQITGGAAMASVLLPQDPEVEAQIYSVAPAEGQRPLDIMTDPFFEEMSNPTKFPYGIGGYNTERTHKIFLRKYYQQRLLDVDGRFSRDIEYILASQYIVENKQIKGAARNYIWRQKPSINLTAREARNQAVISENVRNDKAYAFLKSVRGSPAYYQRTFYDLLAMVRQLGTPTWFLTLTAADMKWPDLISVIARQHGVTYTDEEISRLSFDDKSNWIRRNPVTAARHFQYRLHTFFNDFLKSSAQPLGKIVDFSIRIEFQSRGSPHAHTLIWVEEAPKFGIDDNKLVCEFIDKYVTCSIPREEGKLKEQVLLLQQHKHSSYCRRNKNCRFKFPHPPSKNTLITSPTTDDNFNDASKILRKVRKILVDGTTDVSLTDLLRLAEVDPTDYSRAITYSTRGNIILLKREPSECNVNNYNSAILKAWGANMDIQYVLNAYACVMYVASYIMKAEKSMSELLRSVSEEVRNEDLTVQLRRIGYAFLSNRDVPAQEVVYRILSLPLKMLSRTVVFINTNTKEFRIAQLKEDTLLFSLADDDTNVFMKNLIDRYQHRPQSLQSMCLADFAANYVTDYRVGDDGDDEESSDALPPIDGSVPETEKEIILTCGFGKMKKRGREAVIRFRKFNYESDPSNWYRAKLMLYYPWYDEDVDLLGGYSTYEEHYNNVHSIISSNEKKYNFVYVDDIDVNLEGPPEHIWDEIAPSTEEGRSRTLQEGSEVLTEVTQEDIQANADINNVPQSLGVRFEAAANKEEIPPDQYRNLMRGLNSRQRDIVMFNRRWCKKAVTALRNNTRVEPYRVFLSGPGGVGKSHVIRLVQSDTIKLLRLSGEIGPNDVAVLLTAPTGVAAFNINGMTLHSAFLLGCGQLCHQQLSNEKANTLRARLSNLKLLIIDEVSMVGSNLLFLLHKRLRQIKSVPEDVMFGDVSVLAVGDLYQLPPVGQSPLFANVNNGSLAALHGSGSLWKDNFKMIELREIMRQRGDSLFTELLCRVRTDSCTDGDINVLQSRIITPKSRDYPTHALHVYRLNKDVDDRNKFMLNKLASEEDQFLIKAADATGGKPIDLSNVPDKRTETGNLHTTLKLAVGARVMLTVNVDVSDGLVNGARGEVVHVGMNEENSPIRILVKFDNQAVGLKAISSSPFKNTFPNAVPLRKHETTFLFRGRRGMDITRLQYPLTLAWATTIHKVQGLTLDEIVVDMKGGQFNAGQAYVAFSRVKTLQGLHILNFNKSAIKKSDYVDQEMERLNNNLLSPLPELKFISLKNSHITISLLNVRSINAKIPDILCDSNMRAANVLCFCETWLSPSQLSPKICDGHIVVRCDRQSDNNKGGVMMSVDPSVTTYDVSTFNSGGNIEGIVTKLKLPNSSHIALALLYRSPSSTMDSLLNTLNAIIDHVNGFGFPTLILGDFNLDLLSCNNDSRLINLMTLHNFNQIVNEPTTDRGSLIDHIYYNRSISDLVVEVSDTYYSDHDTIFCSLPL